MTELIQRDGGVRTKFRLGQPVTSWALPQQGRELAQPVSRQTQEMPALCSWLRQQLEQPWL